MGRLLGKGSFGNVYEATCRRTGQLVAVKIVSKTILENSGTRQRLVKEVQVHSQLQHPNVVTLREFFEDEERVYLVMDLCARGDLLSLVRERGRLNEAEARQYFGQLLEAVSYLHATSVLHRDIKLANILLTADGHIKLADFGLATVLNSADSERQTICGTPNYLSPEIVSQQPYSFATDVWSLGVALYAMLTGTPPFQDSKVAGTLERVRSGLFECPAYLSSHAVDLISQLLQRSASRRPSLADIKRHPFLRPTRASHMPCTAVPPSEGNYLPPAQIGSTSSPSDLPEPGLCASPRVLVSGDGLQVELQHGGRAKQHFTYPSLPPALASLYTTAAAFVDVLASATPYIVYCGLYGQAVLREDDSTQVTFPAEGSFQTVSSVCFHAPGQHPAYARVTLRDGTLQHVLVAAAAAQAAAGPILDSQQSPTTVAEVALAVQYALQCRSKCYRVQDQAAAMQAQGQSVVFPVVARSKAVTVPLEL
ncbi:hypothetical protein WJX72_005171 [[Myrmecia] bisecta]|uniref:Protein kinase domain-containing protein n=1 Tax=[Myrmecia] bisecta TaxID=41462 RepID=A0AAW1R6S1_9CHLO